MLPRRFTLWLDARTPKWWLAGTSTSCTGARRTVACGCAANKAPTPAKCACSVPASRCCSSRRWATATSPPSKAAMGTFPVAKWWSRGARTSKAPPSSQEPALIGACFSHRVLCPRPEEPNFDNGRVHVFDASAPSARPWVDVHRPIEVQMQSAPADHGQSGDHQASPAYPLQNLDWFLRKHAAPFGASSLRWSLWCEEIKSSLR